jgi:hypothetical protein
VKFQTSPAIKITLISPPLKRPPDSHISSSTLPTNISQVDVAVHNHGAVPLADAEVPVFFVTTAGVRVCGYDAHCEVEKGGRGFSLWVVVRDMGGHGDMESDVEDMEKGWMDDQKQGCSKARYIMLEGNNGMQVLARDACVRPRWH